MLECPLVSDCFSNGGVMRKPDILSKWLHVGMAICIVLCTAFVLIGMDSHTKKITAGLVYYNLHRFIGINFIIISTIYLIWSARKHGKPLRDLFPWFDARAMKQLKDELRQLSRLRDTRIAHLLGGMAVFLGVGAALLGAWAAYLAWMGQARAQDPLLSHIALLLLLGVVAYLIPWMLGEERAGLGREYHRLKRFSTYRMTSAFQGFGIASGVLATWSGLMIVLAGIATHITFTGGMWLPRAHVAAAFMLMAYLGVHVGVAALNALIGRTEIFQVGKLLERTMHMPVYRPAE